MASYTYVKTRSLELIDSVIQEHSEAKDVVNERSIYSIISQK